jgi:hypothetical protein
MRIYTFLWVAIAMLCREGLAEEPLDRWLLQKVQKDEQLLIKALSQTDDHSLELLKDARSFVPFFYEAPAKYTFESAEQKAKFDDWVAKGSREDFLPGGYIYRLRFAKGPSLYATSAGDWDGTTWHRLPMGRGIVVEPTQVWNSSEDDELLVTLIAEASPRLLVYDQYGQIKSEKVFDSHAPDLDQQVRAAQQSYQENGSPILEMLSLAEYLKNPYTQWRRLELSGQFNLRNQQQREVERSILKDEQRLTRHVLVQALEALILFATEGLFFETSSSDTLTTYDLRCKQGDSVKTIWSTKLPFIKGGKPSHYCGLLQWQRSGQGMLVLVSYTELWGGVLLQFGPNGELMAEIGVGSKWLRPDLFGHIKFEPPDKIKFLKGGDVVVDEYSIKKGALCDKDGKPIQRKVENTKFFGRTASGGAGDVSRKIPNSTYPHRYALDPSKVSLSSLASEDLFFDVSDSATVTTYDLRLKKNNTVKTIWSGQIPLVNGARPAVWYSSVTWRKNDQGMLALVNYDNFQGKLLLFGPKDELIAEMNVGMEWLRSDRFGTVMLEPPDRIKFVGSKGETLNEYLIKDGGLYYKSGLPYERNPQAVPPEN